MSGGQTDYCTSVNSIQGRVKREHVDGEKARLTSSRILR